MQLPIKMEFKLTDHFLDQYKDVKPKFGFNGLGEIVFLHAYSRLKLDGTQEQWWETCKRVVEGCYNIQKQHIETYRLGWNNLKAQKSAQEMFDKMFNFMFLPAGRSLWAQGTDIVMEKGLSSALYNCSMISTENINQDFSTPFCFAFDMLMLGVGVGADTKGAGKITIKQPKAHTTLFVIPDDREGWVESLRLLLESFLGKDSVDFDYSLIRPFGSPIKTFGGTASGPGPLKDLHDKTREILTRRVGQLITQRDIVDIFNLTGKAVIAGNTRRSAEIMLGDFSDEFLDLKNYEKNLDRADYGWASNNSVLCNTGSDYSAIAERIKANGEPGVVWIDNMRSYGRMRDTEKTNSDFRIAGVNPCGEIGLESSELCVSGDTRILTKVGYPKIKDIVGVAVDVWNGSEWSTVVPAQTGDNTKLVRVTFSDGSFLDCTEYHKFSIQTSYKKHREIFAKDLKVGQRLEKASEITNIGGLNDPNAFEWGFFAGDGYIDVGAINAAICGKKDKLFTLGLKGSLGKPQIKEGYTDPVNRVYLSNTLKDVDLAEKLNNRLLGIPEYFFSLDRESTLEFIAGWIETGGTIQKNPNTWNYRIYGTHQKMLDIQLLLRRCGVSSVTVSLASKKGFETNFGVMNYDLYYVTIPSKECGKIPTRLKKIPSNKLASGYTKNNAHAESLPISNMLRQTVVQVEVLDGLHDTFCFTEDKQHKAIFNNVLTKQCNLVDLFLPNIKSKEEFERTIKFAYLYAKTITLLDSHWPDTNRVMLRNRRIGLAVTGITQFIANSSLDILKEYLEFGTDVSKKYDDIYSEWLAIPRSKKLRTIKPSGSLSLLAGVTPGMHYPESQYYIRRMRLGTASPLVQALKSAGYTVEPCFGQEDSTVVVEFPVFIGEKVRTIRDVSMWEQLSLAAFLQEIWADNSVSVTVTFDPEKEGNQIATALDFFQYKLKAVSLLPRLKQGAYKQMPYEEITKEQYEEMVSKLTPLDFSNMFGIESAGEKYCTNDSCSI